METVCALFLTDTSAHAETYSLELSFESGQEDVVYTLFLRYTLDPNKLADWRAYAQAEFEPITESGGRITGYYAPTEFAGATSDMRV